MKRRQWLSAAALGSVSVGSLAVSPVRAQSQVSWRMATSWPQSLDVVYNGAESFCDRVRMLTNGQFDITAYPANELVLGLQVLDAVEVGAVECGHSSSYYYLSKNPALAFGTTVPFGLNAQQQNAWYYYGGGLDTMHRLYADFGVISFPGGNTGAQMGGWFKQPIQSLGDLNGLKMRIPGLGGRVMGELGVDVQVLQGSEILVALRRGAVDAAEWIGPHDDGKLGLNEAASYYYYPGWWEPGTSFEFEVNLEAWNSLPSEYQEAFKIAAAELNLSMLARYDALNGQALNALIQGGTELIAYSEEILVAAEQASIQFLEESSSQDPTFQDVYERWKVFRSQVYGWHNINERGFSDFAFSRV